MTRDTVMFAYSFFTALIVITLLVTASKDVGDKDTYSLLCDKQIASGKRDIKQKDGIWVWRDNTTNSGSYTPKAGEICMVVNDNVKLMGVK